MLAHLKNIIQTLSIEMTSPLRQVKFPGGVNGSGLEIVSFVVVVVALTVEDMAAVDEFVVAGFVKSAVVLVPENIY